MNTEKRRILLLITNLDFGGAQASFSKISLLLQPHCILKLVVFNKHNIAPLAFGAELIDMQVPASNSYFEKIHNFYRRVSRLKKIKKEFKPDISVSFLEGADYVNLLSSQGEEVFFYVHGSKYYDRNIKGLLGFIRKRILIPFFYAKASKLLVVNQQIEEELKSHFNLTKKEFSVMHNFFDFSSIRQMSNLPLNDSFERFFSDHIVICASGRISTEKGLDRFAQILPLLFSKHKTVKLLLVGDGPQRNSLQKCFQTLNIRYSSVSDDNFLNDEGVKVLFLGFQQNPYKFLVRSALLVLPSLNEGMPNTVIEAMGLGVPVVAADCPYGPRELLSLQKSQNSWPEFSEYGVLAPVLNSENEHAAWLSAIDALVVEDNLRKKYRRAGLTRAQEFSHEKLEDKWIDLLKL